MKKTTIAIMLGSLVLTGCQTTRENAHTGQTETNATTMGAITGAIGGAIIGAATASKSDRKKGVLQGLIGGAAIGAGVGYKMDQQERILRQKMLASGVQVKRVGENQLQLVMSNGIGFDTGSYFLQAQINPTLDGIVEVLKEFPQTRIHIAGHTDSVGSEQSNQLLSEQRAMAVLNYFSQQGVTRNRLIAEGFGEQWPLCSNDTAQQRQCNRRVEINIIPAS
ncbi:OmpA family protein [Thalassotalea ponticola]|uniref:OmpA family protein n=1 Tax=Thalassotalea ponticola TaxID=1523392 RepID=UPI0025B3AB62|nr:OmpA family protein [Thalassotalea ponticola]MDN3653259.1 OmpA family protein [Thalassotalea ponticola]